MYDDNKLAREILVIIALMQKPPLNFQRGWRSKIWSDQYFVYVSREGSVKSVHLRRLSWTSIALQCIKFPYAGSKIDDSAEL